MLDGADRDQSFGGRIDGEQLGAIDLVESVVLTAEIAIDADLTEFGQRAVDFILAQHLEVYGRVAGHSPVAIASDSHITRQTL